MSQKPYTLNSSKFLSPQEMDLLAKKLDRLQDKDIRNVLMIRLLLNTGARGIELLKTRLQDVSFENQTLHLKGAKGSADREIPLSKELFAQLHRYVLLQCPDMPSSNYNPPLFPINSRRLRAIWAEYTPNPNKSLHSTRHTFAILLYQRTKDLRLVKVALGHKNIANTMIYAEFDYQISELRRLLL